MCEKSIVNKPILTANFYTKREKGISENALIIESNSSLGLNFYCLQISAVLLPAQTSTFRASISFLLTVV
jgi:hypothetical protein